MAARGLFRVVAILRNKSNFNTTKVNSALQNVLNTFNHSPLSRRTTVLASQVPNGFLGCCYTHTNVLRTYATKAVLNNTKELNEDTDLGAFDKHGISPELQARLRAIGITHLFPVQYHTFKPTLQGIDVIVQARTGTGKTLSFALPLAEKLQKQNNIKRPSNYPRVLVLAPTRELANQVKEDFAELNTSIRVVCLYGGESVNKQMGLIQRGMDVVVGTPGRMLDMCKRGVLNLSEIQHVVLDEVDEMLNMGLKEDVEMIITGCYKRGSDPQTMLYSATMPAWVMDVARKYLKEDYQMINLVGEQSEQTATTIKQYRVPCEPSKRPSLIMHLMKQFAGEDGRAIIFCQTKRECDWLGRQLRDAKVLHGNVKQIERSYIMNGFKAGKFKLLCTTDVASRGLDIPDVSLVIQLNPPQDSNKYIHRVGRTGRAGKAGVAVMLYSRMEMGAVSECEKTANVKIEKLPAEFMVGIDLTEVEVDDDEGFNKGGFERRRGFEHSGFNRHRGFNRGDRFHGDGGFNRSEFNEERRFKRDTEFSNGRFNRNSNSRKVAFATDDGLNTNNDLLGDDNELDRYLPGRFDRGGRDVYRPRRPSFDRHSEHRDNKDRSRRHNFDNGEVD